jgi:hypothetical protein
MSNHPINLTIRFVLELLAMAALAIWGWTQHAGALRFVWAVGLPLLAAALWGVFRVPGDPNKAPVAVPGLARLLIEAIIFGGAVWAIYATGRNTLASVFGLVILAHYVVSYDRVQWLLKR